MKHTRPDTLGLILIIIPNLHYAILYGRMLPMILITILSGPVRLRKIQSMPQPAIQVTIVCTNTSEARYLYRQVVQKIFGGTHTLKTRRILAAQKAMQNQDRGDSG
jgi:hypothetical protein